MNFVSILSLVSIVTASSVFNMQLNDKLTPDFLTGFESGLFMRNS